MSLVAHVGPCPGQVPVIGLANGPIPKRGLVVLIGQPLVYGTITHGLVCRQVVDGERATVPVKQAVALQLLLRKKSQHDGQPNGQGRRKERGVTLMGCRFATRAQAIGSRGGSGQLRISI